MYRKYDEVVTPYVEGEFTLCPVSDSDFMYNEGCITVVNNLNCTVVLKKTVVDCYECNMIHWANVEQNDAKDLLVRIEYKYDLAYSLEGQDELLCRTSYSFGQHGKYEWKVDSSCSFIEETSSPDDPYIPIYFGIVLSIIAVCFYCAWKKRVFRRLRSKKSKADAESNISEATTATSHTTTQISSDSGYPVPQVLAMQVFRGVVILLKILFNGETSRYWFMKTAYWDGIMPADYVYAWFLWGMGSLFFLKYRAALVLGASRLRMSWDIVLRSGKYFLLGLFLGTSQHKKLTEIRIPGELQRYSFMHLTVFLLETHLMKNTIKEGTLKKPRDLMDSWVQGLVTFICVALNVTITYLLPVPDCPTGYRGPGGFHHHSEYFNCTGGAAGYVDRQLFGAVHMINGTGTFRIYTGSAYDPDGFLPTLNCFITLFSGVQAAKIFLYYPETKSRIRRLLLWGVVQIVLGVGLCGAEKDYGLSPLNRNLWSVSFAFLTSGTAFILLTILHVLVDVYDIWSGSPCFETGLNTMVIYAGHLVFRYSAPFSWAPLFVTWYWEFLIMDTITISFWIFISLYLFKRSMIFLI